jgi:hypothetical protein
MPRDEFETELSGQGSAFEVAGYGAPSGRADYRTGLAAATSGATGTDGEESAGPAKNYDRLNAAYLKAQSAFEGFCSFIIEHEPRRTANYPDSHIMTVSILIGLVLAEAVVNSIFFAKGSDLGLLGGWIQAATVSFTNVMAAFFLLGFGCIRMMQNGSHRPVSAVIGWVGAPIVVAVLLLLNKTAAHYRDLLELNADALATGEITRIADSPVRLATDIFTVGFNASLPVTMEGLLLLILGVTFAAIAAYKGATFDDPIIGYGAIDRKLHAANSQLALVVRQTRSKGDYDASQLQDAEELVEEINAFVEDMRQKSSDLAEKALDDLAHEREQEYDRRRAQRERRR